MLVVISIIFVIGACIAYFLGATDLLDTEIRGLGVTQQLSFQKSEIEVSLKRWLEGRPNSDCPAALKQDLLSTFSNFTLSEDATVKTFEQPPPNAVALTAFAATHPAVGLPCFMHPNRYPKFYLKNFKARLFRMGQPNYQALTVEVGANISFDFIFRPRTGPEKIYRQKYTMRFRLEGSNTGNYALILANSPTGTPAFIADNPSNTSIQIHGKTLVLGGPPELTSLAWFGTDNHAVLFRDEVHLSAGHVVVDNTALPIVARDGLEGIFTRGIHTEAVPDEATTPGYVPPVRAPFDHLQESFNNYLWDVAGHLPFTSAKKSASIATGGGTSYFADRLESSSLSLTDARLRSTTAVFTHPYRGADARKVYKTCTLDTAAEPRLFVWSNVNTTLTIDLSRNTSSAFPPIFCGAVAAREIIVLLNNLEDTAPSDPYAHHYLIGKFLVTDSIRVVGKGKLHIVDADSFQREVVALPGFTELDPSKVSQHMGSFSYTIYRNFYLPFLRPGVSYAALPSDLDWIRPMSVVDWVFSNPCPAPGTGYNCPGVVRSPTMVIDASGRRTYPLIDQALPSIFFTARSSL